MPLTEERDVPPDLRPAAVQRLLAGRPLEPFADDMVADADENHIDWRLLPVIAILESSGGLQACGFNAWGWNSCHGDTFQSFPAAIRFLSERLSEPPYRGLTFEGTFCMWVAGDGECSTSHARNYLDNALWVIRHAGESIGGEVWNASH